MSRKAKRATLKNVTGTAHPASRYDEAQRAEAWRLHQAGVPNARIARTIGCHRLSVARWLAERYAMEKELIG